ncbi:MAG: 3-isopropylmalate dehydratase large subunit [Deltaproteobacteria bacterium]|nr:3-isopropylmalate dehydratase large subunit [Deltaproteobacteria bacterium]MBW1946752.1 3-isopropylmalate dehydratase large subunit [Deltaproteobacteria bacterium]MBW1966225.1 3-isopropylmalate dehydratase large subunit [Deltaproteobacteria bacterium]MBW2097228.1 3-isopropylmalate dehydratase large subunit [Deltaproteobacteria bacterium]PXF53218.1 MAG: 3-isopropylmalate dehydratase large subunit [Deltaproteobacteria bacterium]
MSRPMTIAEKILAAHAGLDSVEPGQLVEVYVDFALGNDITAPIAIKTFRQAGVRAVFDREKIALVSDHFVPNKDIMSAEQARLLREFAAEQGIVHHYDGGESGVEHVLLPEKGLVLPGEVVIGADSHTCTYGALGTFATGVGSTDLAATMMTGKTWFKVPESIKFIYNGKLRPWVGGKDLILYTIGDIGVDGALYMAMEFTGTVIDSLSMAGRFTMSNMAIEAGGKVGLINPDDTTLSYLTGRTGRDFTVYRSDEDSRYARVIEYDCSDIEPQVACPHLPENTKGISEVGNIPLDQVVIGSCTNGRLEDLALAAGVISGRHVSKGLRLIVIPTTPSEYTQALDKGFLKTFLDAGAVIGPPTCGPCLGGHMGVLARGERALATTNRNFVGRMGHPESEVYLANPAIAAASAVLGRIGSPDEL